MGKKRTIPEALTPDDWAVFAAELQNETDRGAAVIGAAFLDDLLAQLIAGFFIADQDAAEELLIRPYAPLSSFSARIVMAYSLGLISSQERNDLKLIKDIRNEFAHGRHILRLSDAPIRDIVSRLTTRNLVPESIRVAMPSEPRHIFITTVAMLATFLDMRKRTAPSRLVPPRQIVILEPNGAA